MEKSLKQLLLKDLCARLPYEVILSINGEKATLYGIDENTVIALLDCWDYKEEFAIGVDLIKPYLRPMSSMTEEEEIEYANCGSIIATSHQNNYLIPNPNCVDWLNAHHLDYRGLIDKGLAIEAPSGMYEKGE